MLAKTFAGIVLGLPLSLAVISLAIWIWPGSSEAVVMPFYVAFFPLWVAVMAATYLFRNGARAWAWLAAANAWAFAALFAAKQLLPGL
ncbi:hypothetical protein [Luteibacter sahnii]|uniref:hypothetical protein n=1 Tax=Luteibacter sahnii TaxID=3021977 RepID=UPI002A6B65E2|nr:hypothetical protein [Luteibacter sp. PPL193]MDY1549715.1 hypothetical protein [Luteibacter sp. PPL193]